MTTFDALESSLEDSRPIDVYVMAIGSQQFLRTSCPADIVVDGQTYESRNITRSALGQGSDERNRVVKVTIPADDEFARQYFNASPESGASVSIFRVQRDEAPSRVTRILQFKGVVQSVQFKNDALEAEIVCQSIESGAGQTIPRITFQLSCNWVVFDEDCGADPNGTSLAGVPFQLIAVATAESGITVTVPGVSTFPANWFRGGFCLPVGSGDKRMIIAHSGDVLTLRQAFADPVVGATMQVFAGCDHLRNGGCTKFNRRHRYGGWRNVPSKNPFRTGID